MGVSAGLVVGIIVLTPLGTVYEASAVDADSLVPPRLEERIVDEIADLWSRQPTHLVVEWGTLPEVLALTDNTPFTLRNGGNNGWFVAMFHVPGQSPVSVRFRVGTVIAAPVAARPLPRGHVLAPGDIAFTVETRWGPPLDDEMHTPVPGWTTTRNLERGRALRPPSTRPPSVIRAGEVVELRWRRQGMMIAIEGVALNTASRRDLVRIRLANGRGSVRGVATGLGTAEFESRGRR
jgi:flagella basal body P-ring formation protein FlgA